MPAIIVRVLGRGLRAVSHSSGMCAHVALYVSDVPCVPRNFEVTISTAMRRINVHVYGHTLAQRVEFSKKLPHSTSESYTALYIGLLLSID